MRKLPMQSDTRRDVDYIYSRPQNNVLKKSNRTLICLILLIIVLLVLIIACAIILVKIYLDKKKQNCSEGLFHPDDDEKNECYPCKLSNCKNCKGKINSNICTECQKGFHPEYNDKKEIISCGLKSVETYNASNIEDNIECSDKCIDCDKSGKKCSECESGYFIPDDSDNKLLCEKCSLNNCEKCQGGKNNDICILCKNNFISKYDINNKIKYCNEKCQTGDNKKCKECNFNKNECSICNSGFYLPTDDDIKLECKQCSLEHCISCHGTKNSDICDYCENNYEPVLEYNIIRICKYQEPKIVMCEIGEGDKCLTCSQTVKDKCGSCNPSYKLVDGKCILEVKVTEEPEKTEQVKVTEEPEKTEQVKVTEEPEKTEEAKMIEVTDKVENELNSDYIYLTAKYIAPQENRLISVIYSGKNSYIKQIKVDGISKDPIYVDQNGKYLFDNFSIKEHTIDIWLEINEDILENLFYLCENLISIKFNEFKNNKNVIISSMENIFRDCTNLTSIDLSNLDTKYITYMNYAFANCYSLKAIDLSKNNFVNVKEAVTLFTYCYSLTSINLNTPFTNLELFNYGFYGIDSIKSIDLSQMKPTKLYSINCLFYNCYSLEKVNLNNFKTDLVVGMRSLFYNNYKLTSVDLSQFNTKNVKDMSYMFYQCSSLTYLDLSSFDTSKVTNMMVMFYNCSSLTSINLGRNFNAIQVTDMSYMFDRCTSLIRLDLKQFNTKNVNNMAYMFYACYKLQSVDVSSFDTTLVTKFEHIFSYCHSLTSLDLSNFDFTTSEKYYNGAPIMFYCESLKFIDITPINIIFRDFFTGIPTSGGYIRASRKLQVHLLQSGIKVLLGWDWEIVYT